MKRVLFLSSLLGLLLLLVAPGRHPGRDSLAAADDHAIQAADLWLTGPDFTAGRVEDILITPAGLTIGGSAASGTYLSPVLNAPLPFSALVPQWQLDLPAGHEHDSLTLQLRTAPAGPGAVWTAWTTLAETHDMLSPDPAWTVGDFYAVPAHTHQQFQLAITLRRAPGQPAPQLRQLRLTFIDATAGPSAAELLAQQAATDPGREPTTGGYPKPPVISRDLWCTDPLCDEPGELTYYPVSHLIVHHTVTGNNGGDSAAIVRAIWYYHAVTLGWQDIGYHYLVDAAGAIYEGHAGGDDVIGIHASAANTGSMGVALLGTFNGPDEDPPGIAPPPAMLDSAAEILAWKADQKDIDVFDAGHLPNVAWGLPYLMGHRDAFGATLCPGDQAHAALPALRQAVADRLGFVPPQQYYDELAPETHFTLGNSGFQDGPLSCGIDRHAYYAWSTTTPGAGVSWAEWRPEITAPGRYRLWVYAPFCNTNAPDTQGAVYEVTHAEGTSSVTVNQEADLGIWVPLGDFRFEAGTTGRVYLSSLTNTDNGAGVWFDALRLQYLGATATNQVPPAGVWLHERQVGFGWQLSDPAGVQSQSVRVASDPDFASLVHLSPPLPPTVLTYTHTFSQDYPALYWQVVLTSTQGQASYSAATPFGLDATPPTSAVTGLYRLPDGRYLVTWQGSDALSGIAGYTLEYRATGDPGWTPWLSGTLATSALFTPPDAQATYWFRSQASDPAGNLELPHAGDGDLSTDQALLLTHAIMLPALRKP